jgi:hypothetical protein
MIAWTPPSRRGQDTGRVACAGSQMLVRRLIRAIGRLNIVAAIVLCQPIRAAGGPLTWVAQSERQRRVQLRALVCQRM